MTATNRELVQLIAMGIRDATSPYHIEEDALISTRTAHRLKAVVDGLKGGPLDCRASWSDEVERVRAISRSPTGFERCTG
jgi:hypothetical protein